VAGREEDRVTGDDRSADGPLDPAQAHLRAGDADRQAVADRLRQALDEGRLTVLEYDERSPVDRHRGHPDRAQRRLEQRPEPEDR
jgi:Domain of unknown function (DUF1707)